MFSDLASEVYEREWKPIHDAIFSGRYAMEGAFRDLTWEIVVLPYDWMREAKDFEALAAMAGEAGDTVLVIKDAEIISPPEPARQIPVSFPSLRAVWKETKLSIVEDHVFGRSAAWGSVFTKEDFNLVAGQPRLMGPFTTRLGGREHLRHRFIAFSEGIFAGQDLDAVLKLAGWSS